MSDQKPTLGRIVHYTLTDQDASAINRRRDDWQTYQREQPREATGYVAHVGNRAQESQVYPAVIVRTWGEGGHVNLQVLLDGTDTYWATSRGEGEGPGTWAWPMRKD